MNNAPSFSYSSGQGQHPNKGQHSGQNSNAAQYTHPVHYPNPGQYSNSGQYASPGPYASPQAQYSASQVQSPPAGQASPVGHVHPVGQEPPMVVSRTFQSLEDFIREQDQLDAVRSAEMRARAATALAYSNPNTKKVKKGPPPIDAEVVAAEARAVAEIAATNWTGRLGEYRAAHPTAISVKGLEYNEVGTSRFRCTVTIHEAPHIQFGQDNTLSFAKKKDAKQFASKKAIDWLIASGFMPPDGSVRWPKPTPLPPSKVIGPKIPSAAQSTVTKGKNTFTAQIPPLAHRLGFSPPTYEINRISEEAPFYNGHAHWPNDPRISGKVGEVTNVYGQKNAKEMIAQEVFAFLTDIERQRTSKDEDRDKDAKVENTDVDEPKAEEHKDEEPKAEEPIAQEPKAEESNSVEPKNEEPEPMGNEDEDAKAKDEVNIHNTGAETIEVKKPTTLEHTTEEPSTEDEDRKRKRSLSQEDEEEKSGKSVKLGMPIRES